MRNAIGIALACALGAAGLGLSGVLRAQEDAATGERIVVDRRPLLERVERLRDDLVVIERHLPGRRTDAHEAVDRMRGELVALRASLRDAPPAPQAPVGERRPVMAAEDFSTLRESFRSAAFTKPQIEVVRQTARHAWFTTSQVVELLGDAFNDDVRVEAAVLLYPRAVDPQRYHRVVDTMLFQSSKERLRERLRDLDETE